jgi:hypothetical protein
MARKRIRQNGKLVWITPFEFDPSPLCAVEVRPDGTLDHSGAFDPRYGPSSEAQIEYHEQLGQLDTTEWEVGQPCGS